MKKLRSIFILILTVSLLMGEASLLARGAAKFPSETDPFGTTYYIGETDVDKPFFDEILPEIAKNIKENNKHTISPYYDAFPLANNPENFQGLGHTTYANINGKTVTAEAFYRVKNEGLNDPNNGMGLLIYQCIQYKRAHPEEDVKITFSSYRTSAAAAVCVLPESKYYGYMRSLYTTNYDEHGFVRISFMLTEAARMGIEVTLVNQLNSYNVKQYNPSTKSLKSRSVLSYYTYFTKALETKCYDKYAKGKEVSDFMNFVKVGWKVEDKTVDMQHLKSCTVSHYLATDGTEHTSAVFFGSANLDENSYIGANGNNGSQSGVIVSDHDDLYRVTYNYTQLMAKYKGLEQMFELRKIMNERNMEQYALITAGRENEIPKDEQILYLGSETDSVFEMYFTPFGGSGDTWEPQYNPISKYADKMAASTGYVEFTWNEFGYGNCVLGHTLSDKLETAFANNPDPRNKYSIRVDDFDSIGIKNLKLGTEIGYRSISNGTSIHSKDLLMSYEENGTRHNVCLLTSCNFYIAAFNYRTNSMLVIHETEDGQGNFYDIMAEKYSYGMIDKDLMINSPNLVLEKGQSYQTETDGTSVGPFTWTSDKPTVVSVDKNGKVTALKSGSATITVTDGKNKDTMKVSVVDCIDCYNAKGLTCDTNGQYVLSKKHSSMPLTFEASFYVEKKDLTGTTTILGSDGRYDPALVFSLNASGQPRVAIRDIADASIQSVYTFGNVDVATGEKVHLAITIDNEKHEMYCYVNGELKQTKKNIAVINEFTEKHNPVIGGDHRNGNVTHFTGTIESVAVWSDIRTAKEIASDYKNGIKTNDDKLLCAYDFTQCEENLTKDLSANKNDLVYIKLWQDKDEVEDIGDFDYSFAVIGDTQTMCEKDPDAMEAIYNWLLDNKDEQKISYVLGLGDITDDSTDTEWEFANEYISKLDGKIPYSLARGNHDDWDDFNRNLHNGYYETTVDGMMNEGTVALTDPNQPGLIPVTQPDGSVIIMTREEDIPEGGDVTGDLTNSYRYLNVQGTDYLIMTLDFAPTEEMLKWADSVIEAHPDHKVIITTHAYLYRDGTTMDENDLFPPTYYEGYNNPQNGDDMWEKCFSKHENIVLVLSGHDPWQHIAYRQDKGENGNTVTQMLIDAQYVDSGIGSTGMVAMLYFSNDGKTLTVRYYSVEKDCYGSALSQFTVGLYSHEHEYETIVTPATATAEGKITKRCKDCHEGTSEIIAKTGAVSLDQDLFIADGTQKTPKVTVKDVKGKVLQENTDYTVSYQEGRTEPGTYTVTVTFIGNYSGTTELQFTIAAPDETVLPGDIDLDGKISASDARLALRASVGLEKLDEKQLAAADVDKNGKVTAADARLILRASVGLETLG